MTGTTTTGGDAAAGYRPRLRGGVLLSDPLLRGPRTVHLVKDPVSERAFEVGPREHFLISRMDGTRTLHELGTDYADEFGKRLGEEHWGKMLGMLGTRRLLEGSPEPVPASPHAANAANSVDAKPSPRRNTALSGSIRMVADAHRTTTRLHGALRPLLSSWVMVPLLAAVAALEVAALARFGDLAAGTARTFGEPAMVLALVCLLWLSTALHELAHGVTARHYGGRVGEIGLRWRLPLVMMYCTVEDFPYLATRWQRIATAAAGAVTNLLFLLPFGALWLLAPLDDLTADLLAALLLLGTIQALAMLVPLSPLDGYKITEQLLGTAQLASSTRTWTMLAARRDPAAAAYPARAQRVYGGYAALVVVSVCVLVMAVGLLFHALLTAT
ncbi:metalloprotease [Streptomyces otsuchiensis]|uniref:metalloprotease n=1 Tax=Streptomyces otsuchiensis TaxID=2681388 RepID=UPI00103139FE|nr:M50 family metallopeptidase [Streptomyces otsuchiensis]